IIRMEDDECLNRPLAVILVAQREGHSEETLFMYPFTYCDPPPPSKSSLPPNGHGLSSLPSAGSSIGSFGSGAPNGGVWATSRGMNATGFMKNAQQREIHRPTIHYPRPMDHTQTTSMSTTFGISTSMLASILCVKDACLDHVLELKINNIRFAGYAKRVTEKGLNDVDDEVDVSEDSSTTSKDERAPKMFGINFLLPPNIEPHVISTFQRLSKKLAIAIDQMQAQNGYLEKQMAEMSQVMEEVEAEADSMHTSYAARKPYEKIRERSVLCQTLVRVFDDVVETGIVQVWIDKFVDVSFCVESRALRFASLPPRSRADLDRLIRCLRPYHGLILLRDVWPNADPNPSVALLLKHCTPDKSIVDISAATGIPILQVLLIVRHLLLWARVIIIYPLANNNVYTSSTFTKSALVDPSFMSTEWSEDQIASALAFFNPYASLGKFINPKDVLLEQQVRGRLTTHLLRHQLIMQLHRYYYIIEPSSRNIMRDPKKPCPDSIRKTIMNCKVLHFPMEEFVCQIAALQLEKESYAKVTDRLQFFLTLAPFLNGQHHIEDMMFRINQSREAILGVIDAYSYVIADFLRPDEISALSIY
ncbi:hypothetical protein PFISCL1PPCAC_14892, partial [Pristionchus fissidentatus]